MGKFIGIGGQKRWASRRIGWFGAGRGKKTKSSARLKSIEKKSSQTAASKSNPKQERRKIRKEAKVRQSVRWKAWWRQGNIKCSVSEEYASCWIHQDCHVADEQKAALKKAAGVSGEKDKCQVR